MTQDLTFLYHFDNPGKYKIRLVLRPTKDSSGLEGIYYSNWLNFIVVNYKAE